MGRCGLWVGWGVCSCQAPRANAARWNTMAGCTAQGALRHTHIPAPLMHVLSGCYSRLHVHACMCMLAWACQHAPMCVHVRPRSRAWADTAPPSPLWRGTPTPRLTCWPQAPLTAVCACCLHTSRVGAATCQFAKSPHLQVAMTHMLPATRARSLQLITGRSSSHVCGCGRGCSVCMEVFLRERVCVGK